MNIIKIINIIFIFVLSSNILNAQFTETHIINSHNNFSIPFQSQNIIADSTIIPTLIKDDFIVNSFSGDYGADQVGPNIATDSSGNYAVTWFDNRNGYGEIYAQFYDRYDQPIGTNILVNESIFGNETLTNWYTSPAMAANNKGDYLIAWGQEDGMVLAQKFSKDGIKVNGNFQLNSLSGPYTSKPSIALNESGGFLAVWKHNGSGRPETYSRYFDQYGNPLHLEILVYDSTGIGANSVGNSKHIAVDGQGNFVVIFNVYSSPEDGIYLQRYDKLGQKLGSNVMVNVNSIPAIFSEPAISATDDGHFLIVWVNSGRIYHFDNYFVTDQLTFFQRNSAHDYSSVSSNREDTFIVQGYGQEPLICQLVSKSGQSMGHTTNLSTNSMDSLNSYSSNISNVIGNHFYATFPQYHRGDSDIHFQKYDLNYKPIGDLTKANEDTGSAYQDKPTTYFNKQGQSIILWRDQRNGHYDLYAQVYDSDFNPIGENVQINDIPTGSIYFSIYDKEVSALSDGTFVIAFSGVEFNGSGWNIYLQRVSSRGIKIGSNTLVSATCGYVYTEININEEDQILVGWYDSGFLVYNAFIRKYDKNLSALSLQMNLPLHQIDYRGRSFSMSINEKFNIFVTGLIVNPDTSSSSKMLCGQFYNDEAIEMSPIIVLDSLSDGNSIFSIDNYSIDTKKYIISWIDQDRVHIKRFYSNGYSTTISNSINSNLLYHYSKTKIVKFQYHKAIITFSTQQYVYGIYFNDTKRTVNTFHLHQFDPLSYSDIYDNSSSSIFGNNLLFAYESNKNSNTGYDIWANVQSIDEINFDKEKYFPPANRDILYQNFPNPFNNNTTIIYELLSHHKVKITIYDILGRKVRTLVDKNQQAGIYRIEFESADLPSGIYYCKMEGLNTPVIKMLIIK